MTKRMIKRWAKNWALTVFFLALGLVILVGGFLIADRYPIAAIVGAIVLFTGVGSYQYTSEVLEEEDRLEAQKKFSE